MSYALKPGGPEMYPEQPGAMLFTMVDPHRGFEVAYNRWFERDHFIGGAMEGRYQVSGMRWIATRALKDLRWPRSTAVADPWDAGSCLTTYWISAGHYEEWLAWTERRVAELYAEGRGFPKRDHVHSINYGFVGADYRDEDPVPVILAFERRYAGLVVMWFDGVEGRSPQTTLDAMRAEALPDLLRGSTIEIVASVAPMPSHQGPARTDLPMKMGSGGGGSDRVCQLFFVNGDVQQALEGLHRYGEAVERQGIAKLLSAAPFIKAVAGTDTYLDQIW